MDIQLVELLGERKGASLRRLVVEGVFRPRFISRCVDAINE